MDTDIFALQEQITHIQALGQSADTTYYSAQYTGTAETIAHFAFQDLRSLFGILPPDVFMRAGKALHLTHWARTHQYCGSCGTATIEKSDERARLCPTCAQVYYPRISPAIITAIIREDKILLARSDTAAYKKFSLIAGFVEPGETLEECVAREIYEEVGLTVKNIRYFNSQPWPFPESLMIGFIADYAAGEIAIDNKEISEARWFTREEIPDPPNTISIAGQLIGWWLEQ